MHDANLTSKHTRGRLHRLHLIIGARREDRIEQHADRCAFGNELDRPSRIPGATGRQRHRPVAARLGALVNVGNRGSVLELREVQTAAQTLGLELASFELRGAEDISSAFEAMKGRIDALYVTSEPMVHVNRARINTLALSARLPTVYAYREFVEAGSLMSYGPNFADLHRRTAEIVDKILRGTKPGDIPVEQPTKFDLVVNLTTAQALGLDVPPTLLARADEVIE
jgi:ABC-type uncharacterized transport system substrate-binding protein